MDKHGAGGAETDFAGNDDHTLPSLDMLPLIGDTLGVFGCLNCKGISGHSRLACVRWTDGIMSECSLNLVVQYGQEYCSQCFVASGDSSDKQANHGACWVRCMLPFITFVAC